MAGEHVEGPPDRRPETGLEFGVLGPVQVLAGGRQIPVNRPGMRGLLGMLLLEANQVVPIDRLVDGLWGEDPPATARTIVHGYVSRLRRLLAQADPTGSARIHTRPPGYLLAVEPWRVDVNRVRQLVRSARGRAPADRAGLLREALGLWRGPVLADVPGRPVSAGLEELRLGALEERIEAELELGRHAELVGELRQLVTEYPFRERLVGQLMRALYRAGRRADALAAYQQFHRRAVAELGMDPGPELQALHEQVLRDDPALRGAGAGVLPPRVGVLAPAQLPSAVPGLIGRAAELAWLDGLLGERGRGATTVGVVVGAAGVGKTALAVTWGHQRVDEFPDGQLFAALRGFDDGRPPVAPADVLARFLATLGVAARDVPADLEERAALYRTLLARRRVLVVLDDAGDSDQVRPLLPAGAGSVVLVTSRRRLDGLVAGSGARLLAVDTLSPEAAVELLDEASGTAWSVAEPESTSRLARWCGHLPLALRIAAARLLASPHWTIADLLAELSDEGARLRSLSVEDADVSVGRALDVSYRNLRPELAETFRMLGVLPGETFGAHLVAALCSIDPALADLRLRALAGAHLVTQPAEDRFGLHDLVRLHARQVAEAELTERQRSAALDNVLDYYLTTGAQAGRLLCWAVEELAPSLSRPAGRPTWRLPVTRQEALVWFDLEWPNLVAVVDVAARTGRHDRVWRLALLAHCYRVVRATGEQWLALVRQGLDSARACGDRLGELLLLSAICQLRQSQGRAGDALAEAEQAHRIATGLADTRYLRMTLGDLAAALLGHGRPTAALTRYRKLLSLCRKESDPVGQARVLDEMARVERLLDRLEPAAEHQRQAVELHRDFGTRADYGLAVNTLAEISAELGELAEAEALARTGVDLAAEDGITFREAQVRQTLSQVLAARGELAEARAELLRALALYERVNSPNAELVRATLVNLDPDG
ncbi:DNA-binding transcriptional activator of the SARP family [Goodfellowiella coeruleoviolacea]|uniref:DNA-binding transcriptional activator of the SARP family n=2 Tax=Goodfellowiella coeruleoviolacea TaxID=334858 RepID=A0AAE3KFA1_9PSEU|nr:DNA-binding transcriptional activator of the SARP family [Goodfellowiella coeruleoviolacea]